MCKIKLNDINSEDEEMNIELFFNIIFYQELTTLFAFKKQLERNLTGKQIIVYQSLLELVAARHRDNYVKLLEIDDENYFFIDFPYTTAHDYLYCSRRTAITALKKLEEIGLIRRSIGGLNAGASRLYFPVILPFIEYDCEIDKGFQGAFKYGNVVDKKVQEVKEEISIAGSYKVKNVSIPTEQRIRLVKQLRKLNKHFNVAVDESAEERYIKKLLGNEYKATDIEKAIEKIYKLSNVSRTTDLITRELRIITKNSTVNKVEDEVKKEITIDNNDFQFKGIFSESTGGEPRW